MHLFDCLVLVPLLVLLRVCAAAPANVPYSRIESVHIDGAEQQEALSARPPHLLLPLPAAPLAALPAPSTASYAIPSSEPAKWRHTVQVGRQERDGGGYVYPLDPAAARGPPRGGARDEGDVLYDYDYDDEDDDDDEDESNHENEDEGEGVLEPQYDRLTRPRTRRRFVRRVASEDGADSAHSIETAAGTKLSVLGVGVFGIVLLFHCFDYL